MINQLGNSLGRSLLQDNVNANITRSERLVSVGTGAFIGLKGVSNIFSNPLIALIELGIGGVLLYRGVTGYCAVTALAEEQANRTSAMTDPNIASTSPANPERIDPQIAY